MKVIEREERRIFTPSELDQFYSIPPRHSNAEKMARDQIAHREYPREELVRLLRSYNEWIHNDQAAHQNIEKLREKDSVCIVTGQQLGLMGGPLYTILKAITCIQMAREMNAIPVFWLATEDHDTGEIDHTYLLDTLGNIEKYHLSLPKDGRFVESLELRGHHQEVLNNFIGAVGLDHMAQPEEASYVKRMVLLLKELFKGTGLVFVEPRLLRQLAKPFFRKEIENCQEIHEVLANTTKELEDCAGKAVLKFDEPTQLFLKVDNKYRRKIRKKEQAFQVGNALYDQNEILELIENEPERFSTNAAARPVFQSLLLPVMAYVAGPTEMQYYRQLRDYHQYHDVPMPWIVPRISATLIPSYAQSLLEKCKIHPWDPIPHHWSEVVSGIDDGIDQVENEWERAVEKCLPGELSEEVVQRFVKFCMRKLQRKVTMNRLQNQGIPSVALHYLRNLLEPHRGPQERILNWYGFQATTKENLIQAFLEQVKWNQEGHLYCYL